ncbi:DUF1559 family PulG-like putative transporter [Rubinisphaera italica]|nr:DUF1559 domain-containing protein [Rubinisphaera italica]
MNNLRIIGYATYNYTSMSGGTLPISYTMDAEGNRLLSWRYSLLDLLNKFNIKQKINSEQTWDSAENLPFAATQILEFACPDEDNYPNNGISYFTITGEETLFPDGSSVTLDQINAADGTANTIMLTEAADMDIAWLEPRDIPFSNVNKPPREMLGTGPSSHHQEGFNVFYADGHAQELSKDIDPIVLRALITWNGGEEITEEEF